MSFRNLHSSNSGVFYLEFGYMLSAKTPTKPHLLIISTVIVTKLKMFWHGCVVHSVNNGSINAASMYSFIEVLCNNEILLFL